MAEVAASRQMFADILSLIAWLRAPPAPGMRDRRHQMRQATTAALRLDTATSAHFSGSVPSTHRLATSMRAAGTIIFARAGQKRDPWPGKRWNLRLESGKCRVS